MSILDFFPKKLTIRDVQRDTLLAIEKAWDQASVIVVNLPVASGKSAIALTLAHWQKQASIITPTKLLVDQYKNDYPYIHVLRSKSDYFCTIYNCPISDRPKSKKIGRVCKKGLGCSGCELYLSDLRKSRVMPYLLSNYYIYLAHKLYRKNLIIDEGHTLIDMLKKMASHKLWYHDYLYPKRLKTRQDIKEWVNTREVNPDNKLLEKLREELNNSRPTYLVKISEEEYHGELRPCIMMLPLDIRNQPPVMWPRDVNKIIIMSATISRKDIEQLGFSNKKIIYVESSSPIMAEHRPIIIPSIAKNMSYAHQDINLPKLVEYIKNVANNHPEEKGIIHATYSLAEKLKPYFKSDDRYIFHDKDDKAQQYNKFRAAESPMVLVASGMYEGIDLKFDAGRWQILSKVPWPSLADPAIKYMADLDPDWYLWECLKTVMQATGRICRDPEDYGETFIFDSTIDRLFREGINKGFIPLWFQHSINNNLT